MAKMIEFDYNGFELAHNRHHPTGYANVGYDSYPSNKFRAFVKTPEPFHDLFESKGIVALARGDNPIKLAYYRQQFLMGVSLFGWEYMIHQVQEVGEYNWEPNRPFDESQYQ